MDRVEDKISLFLFISADKCLALSSSLIFDFFEALLKLLNVVCVCYNTLFPYFENMGLFLLFKKFFNESRFLK